MATTLKASLATRREAELLVERLVQEYALQRADISVVAEGQANSSGLEPSGSDTEAAAPSSPDRGDAALNGAILVSVEIGDEAQAADVRAAFDEFNADDIAAG